MIEKKSNSYFTIGEFANLFGISKQTLFYYEKNKIFSPSMIDDNGYRYYSLEQYFIFEIIITLRKLEIPLKKIRDYVQNRNIESLQNLFENKVFEYDMDIEFLKRNRATLLSRIKRLKQIKEVNKSYLTLEKCEEEYLIADNFPDLDVPLKNQIKQIAKHNLPFATNEIFNEYIMGFILSKENFLSGNYISIGKIFTQISYPDEYSNVLIKPAGFYSTITTPGSYHDSYNDINNKLIDFINRNNLEVIGEVYINQIRNYWSTSDHNNYVTKVSVQIDYNS